LIQVISKEKPWSVLVRTFEWSALFAKSAPIGCSPWASCYLEQKVRGSFLQTSQEKKQKTFPEDMYPAAPEPISGYYH
jgi:TorA maturation chaperone TorD